MHASMLRQNGTKVDIDFSGKLLDNEQFLSKYDVMYVYHGNNWDGKLNLYGGMTDFRHIGKLRNFSKFKGKVYSLGIKFPRYHELINERLIRAKEINPGWFELDMKN